MNEPRELGANSVCCSRVQEVKGLRDGEEGGEEDTEEGVTFDVWKKTEVPPPPEPVYDEVRITRSPVFAVLEGAQILKSACASSLRLICPFLLGRLVPE